MGKNVAFFIEVREGKIRNGSFEAATVARKIASETGGLISEYVAGRKLPDSPRSLAIGALSPL